MLLKNKYVVVAWHDVEMIICYIIWGCNICKEYGHSFLIAWHRGRNPKNS